MHHRLPALDWMRGVVLVLMATDHASSAFNGGRLVTDSVFFYDPEQGLGALQFAHRWISHLCAPTFLFLAGTSLALSIERRMQRGLPPGAIDRDLLVRGLIILGVDLFFINWFWVPGTLLLGVMYTIGLALVLMIPLRRLPTPWLIAAGLGTIAAAELFLGEHIQMPFEPLAVFNALFLGGGLIDTPVESIALLARIGLVDRIAVIYPVLPWWAMMALGWAFGRYLLRPSSPARLLSFCGGAALTIFLVLRGLNSYGNMGLLRLDFSWIQWLHCSKYPPSVTFTALELGLMALILAALFRLQDALGNRVRTANPVLVFGQTAFFFYVAHIFLLEIAGRSLGMYRQGGLARSTTATILALVVLYPLCLGYRRFKATHPRSWARFF